MDFDPLSVNMEQLSLFTLGDTRSSTLELYPLVWSAAEALASPEAQNRRAGLDRLVEMGVIRFSPLVAYLTATRISDPDLGLRCTVIKALGDVFTPDEKGQLAPEAVRQVLSVFLSQMRIRQICALLQTVEIEPSLGSAVTNLLGQCSYAGNHLADLLSDRKNSIEIRKLAAYFIGEVGYISAIPDLDRMVARLEGRLNGQRVNTFASQDNEEENILLPAIKNALSLLSAP